MPHGVVSAVRPTVQYVRTQHFVVSVYLDTFLTLTIHANLAAPLALSPIVLQGVV